ncbi:fluoroquinolone export ABC transporter permease subunit [Maledivibacter halophilus]|uniref:Fluoroquinolone transport system permease protein n=1 Tax=Maledivibacter halophilus TaxID=36842 RepID=A0A1T5MIF6_9FIRM|nr:ABC transporter permease [Maledivibacter halophilus]SKC87990.1 fluoroquinolone transport system permease protein [Maledivibacter halophilus]
MTRLTRSVGGDIFLQVRYGFYAVYAFITIVYIILLKQFPDKLLGIILPFIIFSDPSVLGFYFISGLVLLEKGERTLMYLISTPLRIKEYLYSKMISLTLLSIVTSLIIVIFSYGLKFNFLIFILGVTLTSFLFILIGFIAVAKFPTINEYILYSIIYITILSLPLVDYFGVFKSLAFYIFPTQASLLLIKGAFGGVKLWQIIYGVLYLIIWISLAYKLAFISFNKFIILKKGDR